MRILWVTLEPLLPVTTAGKKGVYRRLERICESNKVILYYYYDNESDLIKNRVLNEICEEVIPIKRNSKFKTLVNLIKYPYTVSTRRNKKLIKSLEETTNKYNIDIVNIDFPQMAYFLNEVFIHKNIKVVLNQHNIEWERFLEMAYSSCVPLYKKLIFMIEAFRLKKYEEKLYKANLVDYYTFVSDSDLYAFHEWTNIDCKSLELIPGGGEEKSNVCPIPHSGKNIIFVGVMSNEFNPEGAIWFIKEVLPQIIAEIPDVKFYVVGKDPIRELLLEKNEHVIITGFVDNLDYYYSIADLVVIPILHGGGVKLKLMEAVGYNKFVVSTTQGAKGTEFVDRESILLADDKILFADYCIEILKNPNQNEYLLLNSQQLFISKYSWNAIGNKYLKFFYRITNRSV